MNNQDVVFILHVRSMNLGHFVKSRCAKISHSDRHRKQHAMKIENQQQIWKLTERWDGSQTFINKMVSVC